MWKEGNEADDEKTSVWEHKCSSGTMIEMFGMPQRVCAEDEVHQKDECGRRGRGSVEDTEGKDEWERNYWNGAWIGMFGMPQRQRSKGNGESEKRVWRTSR